jgi:hypothetical protein
LKKPNIITVPIDDLRLVKAGDIGDESIDDEGKGIIVRDYEIEVEDHSPEQTRDGKLVLYFGFENSTQADPLIYRSRVKFNAGGVRITIYADEPVDVETQNGIFFISRRPE